jgi:hypothetical protein
LDRALTAVENRPEPDEFEKMLTEALAVAAATLGDTQWFQYWAGATWNRLADSLMAAVLTPGDGVIASRLSRLLLVAGLIQSRAALAQKFGSADAIFDLLRHRTPMLAPDLFPALLPHRGVELVRAATVSDLYVVRSEWRCYVAGEIVDIRNVMAHEQFSHSLVQIDEREVTATTEQVTTTSQQTSSQETTKTEMSDESQRNMALAIHAEGQVNVSAQYTSAKIDAHAGVSADYSLQDSSKRASQLAREVVSQSVSKVESQVRSERQERTLTRYEETTTNGFNNDTSDHVRGVYRWVDRIDRYQIFRYPDRLHLEFQLPEPGRFLRSQLSSDNVPLDVAKPPNFIETAVDITEGNYGELARKYLAAGVPPPPAPVKAVSVTLSANLAQLPADGTILNPPNLTATKDAGIPSGYVASTVTIGARADPLLAKWFREAEDGTGFGPLNGFHTLALTVAVADKQWTTVQAGAGSNSVQDAADSHHVVQYVDAAVEMSDVDVAIPPVVDKVPVVVTAVGAGTATATIELTCVPTDETYRRWQLDVFDTLLGAHDAWDRAWRAEKARVNVGAAAVMERSPARNAEMIRDEIKRHVIAWLLDENPFTGRGAVAGEYDPQMPKALDIASEIQFLEQALEWTNLNYVPYPYYWAGQESWGDLMGLETVDPDLGRFLRCGSARVVVPARPDLTEAVAYWLLYRQPWLGGPPPVPGSADYLSAAAEIRDLTQPPPDGEPGESWDVRMPTTLRWLDPDPDLPGNALASLGQPPNEPAHPLCPPTPTP